MTSGSILLTGFGAFGEVVSNPTARLVMELDGQRLQDVRIDGLVLPVSYARCAEPVLAVSEPDFPRLVVCTGVAVSAERIRCERIALNRAGSQLGDNDGVVVREVELVAGAPIAYQSNLPLARLTDTLNRLGYTARLSFHAGTYVCNALLFRLLHHAALNPAFPPVGFLHVPLPELRAEWPYTRIQDAMLAALEVLVAEQGELEPRRFSGNHRKGDSN